MHKERLSGVLCYSGVEQYRIGSAHIRLRWLKHMKKARKNHPDTKKRFRWKSFFKLI